MRAGERVAALALAVAIDLALGEPPNRWHPVAWLGALADWLLARAPRDGAMRQMVYGAAATLGLAGLAAAGAEAVERATGQSRVGRVLAEAALLKSAFSLRMLLEEAGRVERCLEAGDLEGARQALRALVSRDTTGLGRELLAAAAIESLAENASDAVVAPLLAWLAGGGAAMAAYRAVNTLDAMVGYRGRYEYLGKVAARLDDLLNLLPSRLTALLLVVAAALLGENAALAWRTTWRDHGRTASPNAGWPMAAMAGALGRRLEKVGHYTLGDGQPPAAADIARARRLYSGAVALALLATAAILFAARHSPSGARDAT